MLRKTDEKTGRNIERRGPASEGESRREAWRQRELRQINEQLNKGVVNDRIREFLRS